LIVAGWLTDFFFKRGQVSAWAEVLQFASHFGVLRFLTATTHVEPPNA
jgi:hypothetical protein